MKGIIRITLITILSIINCQLSIAQIGINETGASPNASAILDVSSSDKGVLIPRMDSTSRNNINSPAEGLMVYDSTTNSFWFYANAVWNNLNSTFLSDTDNDTKIQVEESSDEDIIRFDMNGTEHLRLENGRMEILNTGRSVFIGEGAGENDNYTDNDNVFVGYQAGYNNTNGRASVFQGYQAGYENTTAWFNTFLGYQAGFKSTTGGYNTFTGFQSGLANTTGTMNTFMGYQSGDANTTGVQNIFYGASSGTANTTGSYNTFSGVGSGLSNTTGSHNTFLGYTSGYTNTTGSSNTFVGIGSGTYNTTGDKNVSIGREAGFNNSTGNKNVFIGYRAGFNETESNKLYIENSNTSNPLIYGEFNNNLVKINGQFFATDTVTLSSALIVNGQDLSNTAFIAENGNTHTINNDDDFVVGGDSVNWSSGIEKKLFFNQSKGAFRVGGIAGDHWDESNTGSYSFSSGFYNVASGYNSTAFGRYNTASGSSSVVWGSNNTAPSYGETVFGTFNTEYTPIGDVGFVSSDRLFVIGNGQGSGQRSDAMIVYKSGDTEINGQLTVSDTMTLSSALIVNGKDLSNIAFTSENGLTKTIDNNDDFVVGVDNLNWSSGNEDKLFFDKSKAAFRVGRVQSDDWDESNLGNYSFATGLGNKATGSGSFAAGSSNEASDLYTVSMGSFNKASGLNSTAFGYETTASNSYATTFGKSTTASGYSATALGDGTTAPSYAETAIGVYNTTYTPNQNSIVDEDDRLFIIGNGTNSSNRSDAMIVYKSGNTEINGALVTTGDITISNSDQVAQLVSNEGSNYIQLDVGGPSHSSDAIYIGDVSGTSNEVIMMGSVGIGTDISGGASYKLEVSGDAAKSSGSMWTTTSDRRLKSNIETYTEGTSEIMKIKPVTFQYNQRSGYDTSVTHVGVIAQELMEVAPYMVDTFSIKGDNTIYYTVNASAMTYMLINTVQEQQTELEQLKLQLAKQQASEQKNSRIEALEAQVSEIQTLKQQNAEMKAMLQQIQAQIKTP